jgi:NAD(P)-dependent dehydrogenase (short-subunit alcohol dehydrogenase family)
MKTDLIIDLLAKEGRHIEEGWVRDVPMGRLGHPSELQGTIVWMASDASSYLNGSDIVRTPSQVSFRSSIPDRCQKVVDGGYCCW